MEDKESKQYVFPLKYSRIEHHQQKDAALQKKALTNDLYTLKTFCGGKTTPHELIVKHDKIVIPKDIQEQLVQWYHTQLCHPGETQTEATIRQHFYWKDLQKDVQNICKKCPTCQKAKQTHTKYGHLLEKQAEATPWEQLCIDLIRPYNIKRHNGKTLILWCVTMINPATGWFEVKELKTKESWKVANIVEQTWLTQYPWPTILNYNQGTEFMAEFA